MSQSSSPSSPSATAAGPGTVVVDARVLAQLRSMFPQTDDATLEATLRAHMGHTGMAINALLDPSATQQQPTQQAQQPSTSSGAVRGSVASVSRSFYGTQSPRPWSPLSQSATKAATSPKQQQQQQPVDGSRNSLSSISSDSGDASAAAAMRRPSRLGSGQRPRTATATGASLSAVDDDDDDVNTWAANNGETQPDYDGSDDDDDDDDDDNVDSDDDDDDDCLTSTSTATTASNGTSISSTSSSSTPTISSAEPSDAKPKKVHIYLFIYFILLIDLTFQKKKTLQFLKGLSGGGGNAQFTTDVSSHRLEKRTSLGTAKSFLSTKLDAAKKAASSAASLLTDAIASPSTPSVTTISTSASSSSINIDEDTTRKPGAPPRTLKTLFQAAVSKDRQRFVNDDFDLDLAYITPRIIAMSLPGEGLEAAYRNSIEDVAALLRSEHGEGYMVYNLSQLSYDISKLNHQVLDFGWPDHQAPPLKLLFAICASIDSWLRTDPSHVVSIHCKGGKGRTGTVICSYMLLTGACKTEKEAMERFGTKRMAGNKMGVAQPSQQRYIRYFKAIVYKEIRLHNNSAVLHRINIAFVPKVDHNGQGRPFIRIYQGAELVYATATKTSKDTIKYCCSIIIEYYCLMFSFFFAGRTLGRTA